jgi:outer membrane protein, multidrug efflux system
MRTSTNSMNPAFFAALLMAVGLAGCAVGPEYQRPKITPTPVFKSQIGPSEANSIADLPWWEVFNDKALQSLITQALAGNYDLQTATARIEQARALVGVSQADLYPQVGYEGTASRQKAFVPSLGLSPFIPSKNITYNAFGAILNATWELDVWGRIRHSTEAARAGLYAQEDVRRGVMLTLVTDVAAAYFVLVGLDRQLAIAQDSAVTYKRTLDLFSERFGAGRDSKLPVVRAQAAYDSANANIASLTRAITQQENVLSVLLGGFPGPIDRGTKLVDQTLPPQTPVGLTTDVLQRRPDILQAEQAMIGANAEMGVAVANFYPRIGLSALFGGQAERPEDIFKSNFNVWGIAAGIAGPIFTGGRLKEQYNAQKAFWDQTIAQYKSTVVNAFRETSDALIAQQTLITQRAALKSQVDALRESVDLSLDRYNAGRASYFEVLEAEQQLFPSEDLLAQTQRDQLVAVVSLYKALGGGWNLKDEAWARTP